MSESTQPALVLADTVTGAAVTPVHFPNFPGLWVEGQPIALSELGFPVGVDVYELVDELGLPLEQTTVEPGGGLMPAVDNHYGLGVEPGADDDPDAPAEPSLHELAVAGNADVVIESLAAVTDPEQLAALRAAETAGKGRTTVLAAIDARTEELTPGEGEVG